MRHKIGIIVVAVSTVVPGSASIAMLAQRPDVSTTIGRLLWPGALANVCLAFILFLVAVIPRNECPPRTPGVNVGSAGGRYRSSPDGTGIGSSDGPGQQTRRMTNTD